MAQFIYGKNVVIARIKENNDIDTLYLTKENKEKFSSSLSNVNYEVASKSKLDSLARTTYHQGFVAKIKEYPYYELAEVLNSLKGKENPLLLMLDGIKDPHNFGAILRTCDAIGVDGVIIDKDRSCPLNSTVARTSTGAIETVKVIKVSNLTNTIQKLKKEGYWIVAAEADEAKDYRDIDYKIPLVVVVGSEGEGISRLVRENSDFRVKIPMIGSVNSLNVSIATALILYEVYNNRFPI